MANWKIKPAGVSDVLKKVDGQAKELSDDIGKQKFDDLGSALSAGAGGLLQEVPAAVNALVKDQSDEFELIKNHIQAGLAGVYSASYAYANAQIHMSDEMNKYNQADAFEGAMLSSAKTGNMDYLNTHTYDEHGNLVVKPSAPKPAPGAPTAQ